MTTHYPGQPPEDPTENMTDQQAFTYTFGPPRLKFCDPYAVEWELWETAELSEQVADWKAHAALEQEAKDQRDKWQKEALEARQMADIARAEIDDLKTQVADLRAGHEAIRTELEKGGITEGSTVERIKQLVNEKAAPGVAIEIPEGVRATAELTLSYLSRWYEMASPQERQLELPLIMRTITQRWDQRGGRWQGVVMRVNGRLTNRPALKA